MAFKKKISLAVVWVLILTLLLPGVTFAQIPEIKGHWAEETINRWVDKGLLTGYGDGTYGADKSITRAEFVAFTNRVFGYRGDVEENFADVPAKAWYAGEIAAAKAHGYIGGYGDGTFRPEANISREEVCAIIARVMRLKITEDYTALAGYQDAAAIDKWSKGVVNAAVAGGYMGGYGDKTLKVKSLITRAEAVAMLDRAAGALYSEAGTYGPETGAETIAGNVTVNTEGVTLRNMVIEGVLHLAAGIGEGDVTLDNVQVKGTTLIRGGGENSVVVNNSTLGEVVVVRIGGRVRIVAKGDSTIEQIIMETAAILQEEGLFGAGFENVTINVATVGSGRQIELEGEFESVVIESAVETAITADTVINNLQVTEAAAGAAVNVAEGAAINNLTLNAQTTIGGTGTIASAAVNAAGCTLEQPPAKTVIAAGVTANVGGKEAEGTVTGPDIPSPEPEPSSGGGGSKPRVSAISVDPVEMYLELDKTATIKATVLPGNATNKRVTWTTSDESIATVANGVVTPVAVGEATITATTVDGGFIATCVVSVINPISESADVVAGDFGVMDFSHVMGYNVGFVLSDATASDVKRVVITLYGAEEKVLATNTSAGILEQYSDATSLSAPFDVFGNFDYVEDGCWDYSGWQVDNTHIPTKATITVTFKNGVEKTVTNDNHPTGDISIFSKKVVNTNTLVGYDTIQEAINAAEPGHVLNVAPGTYEEPVIINKANLTVKSTAGAEKTILDGDRGSVTLVNIKADGVTFSGFTLQNAQKGISINSSNNSITNNIVADVSYWSIELNGTGNYLEGNLVKDQGSWGEERQPRGIFLYGATNAKLRNNKLVNAGFSSGSGSNLATHDIDASNTVNGKPVYYWVDKTEETVPTDAGMAWLINCDKMTVQGLHIDSTERAIYVSGGSHHKILNNVLGDAHGSTFPKQKNITHRAIWVTSINDSEISYNTIISARSGIEVEAGNNNIVSENTVTDSRQAIVFNGGEGNSARGNVLVNFIPDENYVYEPARWTAGFTVWNSAKDTRLEGNHLANFEWGINQQIDPRSGGKFSAFGTVARDNIIIGSIRCPAATNPISDRVLDARYNYWGFKEGPYHGVTNPDGQGQPIGDNILFYPWYENEDLTQQYFIGKIVNARTYSVYRLIQEAIDQAQPGDTIWVDSGTFAGDLKVDKEGLALESLAGADATTISGNITITAGGATIEGFTIDGEVEGSEGFDPQAIFEDNVFPEGSRIIGNKIMVPAAETVYNLRTGDEYECIQSAVSEAELGDTILVGSGTYEEDLVIAVENLTLVSVEKHAAIIETQGDFEPGLGYGGITILADGVTIDGFKIKQSVAQAIVHTHNADGVTIKNNSISGIEPSRGIDIGYASAGSNSVTVEGNEFADLYCGVYVNQGNNLVVESNVFNGMNGGAVVFDGTWGNTNNITVKDNEAKGAEYLLYFYDAIGSVAVEGNDLTNTKLSNYGVYNSELGKYFPTLQAAVGAASTGDTLLVAPGDYDEILEVKNKSLTIVGLDKENTKVKAISAYPGSSNDLVIKNLTVYGNNGSGQSYAGVYIANGNVTIDGCNIHGTDRIYHGIMTETGNTGNVIIQNCDLLGYKWPYFNPSQGSIMLEGNDFHGSGPSIDGFTNVTVTGNRNMSIGLAIGYGLLNKEHGEVLDGLSSELKAFAVMLHSENTDVVVKLSTNDTDTGAWGGYYTGLDEEGNLTITEQYLSK